MVKIINNARQCDSFGENVFKTVKKMVLRFTINFSVILIKISVAIATDILEIAILLTFGCHGNQIKYGHHGHFT